MYYDAIDLLKGMISRPSFSREIEEKKSRFIAHIFSVENEDEAEQLKKEN